MRLGCGADGVAWGHLSARVHVDDERNGPADGEEEDVKRAVRLQVILQQEVLVHPHRHLPTHDTCHVTCQHTTPVTSPANTRHLLRHRPTHDTCHITYQHTRHLSRHLPTHDTCHITCQHTRHLSRHLPTHDTCHVTCNTHDDACHMQPNLSLDTDRAGSNGIDIEVSRHHAVSVSVSVSNF